MTQLGAFSKVLSHSHLNNSPGPSASFGSKILSGRIEILSEDTDFEIGATKIRVRVMFANKHVHRLTVGATHVNHRQHSLGSFLLIELVVATGVTPLVAHKAQASLKAENCTIDGRRTPIGIHLTN